MANVREPILQPIPILSLRPTQMTVGMREVKEKRKRWREQKSKKKQAELLGKHMIPVVHGPDKRYYVIDHHHLARALHDEGVKDILVTVVADLTMVDRDAFWVVLDDRKWVYPYNAKGERQHYRDIPKTVVDLKDDPFRSLAGELRRIGGFAKDTTPVQRIPVGGFPAPQIVTQERGSRFRESPRESAGAGEKQGRGLFARLVRTRGGSIEPVTGGKPISAAAPSGRTRRSDASK